MIFVGLLIHVTLFYFIGTNLNNLPLFTFFLWVLFTFNSIWLAVMRMIIPKELIIPEWIQLNSITAAFLFAYFFPYPYFIGKSNYEMLDDIASNVILLVILISRSILDYVCGWKDFYVQTQFKK